MGSVNKVILVGNLGKDAEVRITPGGQSVASFSMATTEKWTSREGEKKEQTEWHRIVLWGKAADSLQPYLVKGKRATRYFMSQHAQREVITFDRGGGFAAGEYILLQPYPGNRLGDRLEGRDKASSMTPTTKRRKYTFTEGIRTVLGGRDK